MAVTGNILIVEDEQDWCAIFERVARRQGFSTIKTTYDLAGAEALLETMKFAVAFVDIGLDVDDDRNIDGLRVMDKIRRLGDETSIIVVTGRSGMDVLPITRDAIKKYGAFDTVGKVPLEPTDIARLLAGGIEAYKDVSASQADAHEVLRGRKEGWKWDDSLLRATHISGGANGLYGFVDRLFGKFLPVLGGPDGADVRLDPTTSVAHGEYWSRAVGAGLVVLFGRDEAMGTVAEAAKAGRMVLGRYAVDGVLNESSAGSVRGAVYALRDATRDRFG